MAPLRSVVSLLEQVETREINVTIDGVLVETVLGHYSGFRASQLSLVRRHPHKEVKIILYAFRVLMTGINAVRTGHVEANIVELNKTFQFDFIDQLVDMKIGRENSPLGSGGHSVDWYIAKAEELRRTLEAEATASELPPAPDPASIDELDDLLYALRVAP